MALNNLGLGFVFTARNLASGTINRLKGQLGGLAGQSRVAGIAMKAGFAVAAGGALNLVAGLGILGGAFALAGAAGNFEQQMSLVGQLADASGERLENLRNAAIEAGLATKFSPDEAVEGLRNLITAGMQAEQAAEALTPSLQVATFGMISVADAGAAVVGSMNAFRSEGLSAQEIADRLATAMARTNFQATDFNTGLSAAAATLGQFNQTLDTTLVGLGLLRNMNMGATVAATSLREATRRLGSDQRAQAEAFKLIGREGVFSEGGEGPMRNILEIISDLDVATRSLSSAQRQQSITAILGARGLATFAAVTGAELRTSMADGTTQILRGIDAARELERQMRSSAGMADRLQRAVSEGNYAGVVQVLQGVAQTLAVEVGRPIAEVLVPVIVVLRDLLTDFTRFVNQLPNPVKRFGAALLLLSGVMLVGAGVGGLLVGALVLILPVIETVAIAIGVMAAAMIPFIALSTAAGAAIAGFAQIVRMNVGGIAGYFSKAWDRVKLVFQGIMQLFSQGGFSGAVREEMDRASNQGIRKFVIDVYRIGSRIIQFFTSIRTGFSAVSRQMAPRIAGMVRAFERLFAAFGFVSEGVSDLVGSDMNSWAETGARVGGILADAMGFIVDAIRRVTQALAVMVEFFTNNWRVISPFVEALGTELASLGSEIESLFSEIGIGSDDSARRTELFGVAFGLILQGVVIGIVEVVRAIVWMVRALTFAGRSASRFRASLLDAFVVVGIRIQTVFANMVDSVRNSLDSLLVYLGRLVARIPPGFRPEGLDNIVRSGMEAEVRIGERQQDMKNRTIGGAQKEATQGTAVTRAYDAEARARSQSRDRQMDAVVRALETERARDRSEAKRPIEVHIDGERVASAVAGANRREGARGFVPTPSDA